MKKQGMAVPIVLIFATIMGFVAIFLLRNTRDSNAQTQTNMEQLQSYFIARAGVEHAMIKVKYLNRELYDAMCMQQGRNPLFDYSQIKDEWESTPWNAISEWNPGPIFLYPQGESYRLIKGVNSNMSGTTVASSTWINVFKSDLVSKENPIPSNSVLDISDAKAEIQNLLPGYVPFESGEYYVPEIRVSASKVKKNEDTKKLDNNLIIEFTVKSNFLSAKGQAFDYEIKRTIKVSRD